MQCFKVAGEVKPTFFDEPDVTRVEPIIFHKGLLVGFFIVQISRCDHRSCKQVLWIQSGIIFASTCLYPWWFQLFQNILVNWPSNVPTWNMKPWNFHEMNMKKKDPNHSNRTPPKDPPHLLWFGIAQLPPLPAARSPPRRCGSRCPAPEAPSSRRPNDPNGGPQRSQREVGKGEDDDF